MEITSVKIQGKGYLLNGIMIVPKADGNKEYELIKEWLKDNTPEPEFTEAELVQQALNKQIAEAKAYLASTDFKDLPRYVPKDGEDMEALYAKRDEAREFIRTNDVPNP